jgi:putative peptide zinc metalloprotease protein
MTLALRPTFSESWYRVVDLRPRLRTTAQISRVFYRGERWYVVRDPAGNQFHRLSDAAYRFVGLLDGHRTIGEAWELVGGQLADDAPTQPEVIQILSQLYAANLIETNVTPDASVLLRRHKRQREQKFKQRLMNTLFPRIPFWDPDRFLKRWMPLARVLFSRFGAVVWLLVVGAAVALVTPDWKQLGQNATDAIHPDNWIYLTLVFIGLKFLHELGHAFGCRRFGGECHEMGIMLLVLVPTPYVDASSAWGFASKWQRIFVGAGGMIVELFVAALCAFIWKFTSSQSLINQLAYNAMLIASFSTVLFNANPLLRYDGYYMLSDFLEIPNLQMKSREYALGLFKRHVFGVKSQQPLPPIGQRVWLFLYHYLSSAYRIFVSAAIMLMVLYSLPEQLKLVGVLMFAGAATTFFVVPIFKLVKYLAIEPELHRKRTRATIFCVAMAAVVGVLVGAIPFPLRARASGPLMYQNRSYLYAVGRGGFVSEVVIRDGQHVTAETPVLRLSNAALDRELNQARAKFNQALAKRQAAAVLNQANRRAYEAEVELYRNRIADLEREKEDLNVKAPIDGVLVAPQLAALPGKFLSGGKEPIGMVAGDGGLVVYASLSQDESELVHRFDAAKTPAEVRVEGATNRVLKVKSWRFLPSGSREVRDPLVTFAGGGELQADPTDQTGRKTINNNFELEITLDTLPPDFVPVPGQRATVRFDLGKQSLAQQGWRKLQQLLQSARQNSPS